MGSRRRHWAGRWLGGIVQDVPRGGPLSDRVGDCGEIESIGADQGFRGRGLGFMLAKRLVHRFQQIGLRTCRLEVRTANAVAIDLYERLGFRIVSALPSYYANGGDALLMEKTLGGNPPTARNAPAQSPYLRRGRR